MTRLSGRTVAITGAGGGIGRALALELATRGCSLALSDVDGLAADRTAEACRALDADVAATPLDVRDRAAMQDWAAATVDRFGVAHVIVNNAGVSLTANALDQTHDDIDRVLGIDLGGVINGTQAFLPHLVRSGAGHVVNISSVFGLVAAPSLSAYVTAKHGVRGYSESIAMDMTMRRLPVRVSCVHPGGVRTDLAASNHVAGDVSEAGINALFAKIAVTTPEHAARRIARGIEHNRLRILIGPDARALALGDRVLGAQMTRVVGLVAGTALRWAGNTNARSHA